MSRWSRKVSPEAVVDLALKILSDSGGLRKHQQLQNVTVYFMWQFTFHARVFTLSSAADCHMRKALLLRFKDMSLQRTANWLTGCRNFLSSRLQTQFPTPCLFIGDEAPRRQITRKGKILSTLLSVRICSYSTTAGKIFDEIWLRLRGHLKLATFILRDFRLPPLWKWYICSYGILRSVEW